MKRLMRGALLSIACGALVAATGCTSGGSQDPGALEGVEWRLAQSSVSSTDLGAAGITAVFKKGQLSGFSGVNQYSGKYAATEDGTFEAGPFASTMMAGPEPLMRAESAYLKLLEGCTSFSVETGKLTLSTGDAETLVFEEAKAVELPGSSWVVTGYNNGKEAVVSPSVGSTLTLDFGSDGSVSGNGGVNTFNGPFEATGKAIKIGPLAATMMAGEPALAEQETAYLKALEAATTWSVVNGALELRDASGAMQVNAIAP